MRKKEGKNKNCLTCGKEFYVPKCYFKRKFCSRKCIVGAGYQKGHYGWRNGVKYSHKEETKKKISSAIKKLYEEGRDIGFKKGHKICGGKLFKKGNVPWNKGKSGFLAKEKHYNWKGGISQNPYPYEFNKELKEFIRKRDDYICQNCLITEEEHLIVFGSVLVVHHIDYNKQNLNKDNLVTVCISCNSRANYNRWYWKVFYNEKVYELYR